MFIATSFRPAAYAFAIFAFGSASLSFAPKVLAQERDSSLADVQPSSESSGLSMQNRSRVYLGPMLRPAYPGADRLSFGPYFDYSRARAEQFFGFEAPDESHGFNLLEQDRLAFGVVGSMVGKRKSSDVDGLLPSIGRSVELGLSGQAWVNDAIRVRVEGRKAITGHKAFVGNISADYVIQTDHDLLISVGPRLALGDGKFFRQYYGVDLDDAGISGLPYNRPSGGLHSVGVAGSVIHQFSDQWGFAAFARYERLVGDAASSPVTKAFGSRSQPSVGVALSYSFASRR